MSDLSFRIVLNLATKAYNDNSRQVRRWVSKHAWPQPTRVVFWMLHFLDNYLHIKILRYGLISS